MAIEVRGNSHRVTVFDGKRIVVRKSFRDPEAAREFERIEKAKLLLTGPQFGSYHVQGEPVLYTRAVDRAALKRLLDAKGALRFATDPAAKAAAQAEIDHLMATGQFDWRPEPLREGLGLDRDAVARLQSAEGLLRTTRNPEIRAQAQAQIEELLAVATDPMESEPEHGRRASDVTLREVIRNAIGKLPPHKPGQRKSANRYALEAFLDRDSDSGRRLAPFIGKTLDKLRHQHFRTYRDRRLGEVSKATVVRELGRLHTLIESACDEHDIDLPENPASIKHPKGADQERDRRLDKETDEEARLLKIKPLKLVRGDDPDLLRDATIVAIDTAMRQGEILKLRPSHGKRDKLALTADMTKNRQARDVPLLTLRVREVIKRRAAKVKGDGLLFDIDPDTFKVRWARAVRGHRKNPGLGIKNLTFHDLRHEATSRLFELKHPDGTRVFSDVEIMRIVGHKSLIMLRRYLKSDASELAARVIVEEDGDGRDE
jgi:integrase